MQKKFKLLATSSSGLESLVDKDETLRIVISSKDELGSVMPGTPGCTPDNGGIHILHTGGITTSYLQLPLLN